ncbi:bifunctional precorrin-2 dehydrogenase/sirohydrochlorin ferrochelatase [Desulfobacterales bacterium HSG17]|nr:bifunctional precorrin-2 dehydrogenase/sirohydrochlorin ferrochelatase [Desulfobacterales bacterium HSG17]
MKYYPINLDVRNKNCLVVGGGTVGTRKVLTLLQCRAVVTIISPEVTEKLDELALSGSVKLINRGYASKDLQGMFLVISASDNNKVNQLVYEDAAALNILCNIADIPDACNFTLPSVISRGDLTISVSTSGKSPALSRKLRIDLEKIFGKEYSESLKLMGAIRTKLLKQSHAPDSHRHLFRKLLDKGLIEMIKNGDTQAVNDLLFAVFGKGYTCETLMKIESKQ